MYTTSPARDPARRLRRVLSLEIQPCLLMFNEQLLRKQKKVGWLCDVALSLYLVDRDRLLKCRHVGSGTSGYKSGLGQVDSADT